MGERRETLSVSGGSVEAKRKGDLGRCRVSLLAPARSLAVLHTSHSRGLNFVAPFCQSRELVNQTTTFYAEIMRTHHCKKIVLHLTSLSSCDNEQQIALFLCVALIQRFVLEGHTSFTFADFTYYCLAVRSVDVLSGWPLITRYPSV